MRFQTATENEFLFTHYFSFGRYMVITKPYGKRPRKQKCVLVIIFIWLSSVLLYSPKLFVNNVQIQPGLNQYACAEFGWSFSDARRYIVTLMTLTYFIPVIVSSMAYGKAMHYLWDRQVPGSQNLPADMKKLLKKTLKRAKICRRMLRILLVFILLHLPSTVLTVFWYFGKDIKWTPPNYIWIVAFHAEIIKYANSAVNPILFCVLDPSFRIAIRSCFTCKSINQSERSISMTVTTRSTSV